MQPDCDLLPIKGTFVSQLKPLVSYSTQHHFAKVETDVSVLSGSRDIPSFQPGYIETGSLWFFWTGMGDITKTHNKRLF